MNNDIVVSNENRIKFDAIANGTTEGIKLAANVGAMLLVFIAFIAMVNFGLGKLGDVTSLNAWVAANTTYSSFSLEFILGYTFAPLWLIGVPLQDMALMGQLLGIKLAASEFVGYIQLSSLKDMASEVHFSYQKSVIMATICFVDLRTSLRSVSKSGV